MRVYNINKAVGLASSGVEYAQMYRRDVLAEIDWVEDYYVFTDYMPTNPCVFTDRLGFPREKVLWIYNLVSGRETQPCALSVDEILATIEQPHGAPQTRPDHLEIALTDSPVRYRIKTQDGGYVERVETIAGGQLVRVEHYDKTLNNVVHFHDNRVVRRVFYTADRQVAAEQSYRPAPDRGEEIVRTLITPASPLYERATRPGRTRPSSFRGDVVLDGRSQFFQYVFRHLLSRPDDVVIVDRALGVIDAIYPVIGGHRLISVVHAEHFDLKQVDDGVLLWNNHYENVFSRPDMVDAFVVSTRRQQETLARQLAERDASSRGAGDATETAAETASETACDEVASSVVCIPVGVAQTVPLSPDRDPYALVTASRLAEEKHIDILIRVVALARKTLPDLRLDVYGEGIRDRLLAVVEETRTSDCVRLMGHRTMAGLLGSYGLYVSASTSEGFGLSLLEAMAEGLPIVGFDVDYGNREMVEPGVNGALVPFTNSDVDVERFAEAVVETLTSGTLEEMRRQSLKRAEAYSPAHVRERWERLLRGEHREHQERGEALC